MPHKDPERRLAHMAAWRKKKMAEGYGKALYARRKAHYENEKLLRQALSDALVALHEAKAKGAVVDAAVDILTEALIEAPEVTKMPIRLHAGADNIKEEKR